MGSISHHITPLAINSLGGRHTHAYRHSWTEVILRNQAHVCGQRAPGLIKRQNLKILPNEVCMCL